ncbi:hypothetical protein [Actinoplanes sp. NPDC049802]|uniref:hypothetical protein n=1 Tax=Actinoplanes sp. NPDC049802 TaxID=3154742 RepID=UPI0033EDA6A0
MPESAWVNFYCETDKKVRVASFRRSEEVWQLVEVGTDVMPEGGAIPGRIAMTGAFGIAPGYTGCPGCRVDSYAGCGRCGELNCWRAGSPQMICAGCGEINPITHSLSSASAMDVA